MFLHQTTNSRGNYNYNAFIYKNISWLPHFHGNYELIYVFEGVTEISVNGVSDTLSKGELILLPPYTVHSLKISNGKTWVGVFSEDFIISYSKKYKYVRYSKFKCVKEVEEFLKNKLFFQGTPEKFICISCLYMMCNECIKNATPLSTEQNNDFIHNVLHYVYENIDSEITLKDIADSMNYEYHYFSSLFNQCFGMNFKNFINQFRFEKACELLSHKENLVTYVAECCGFGSIRNFNRVFKNMCGCTPQQYKKKQTEKTQKA